MIELHIFLEPVSGNEEKLEAAFREAFVPAISVQEGFRRVAMLKVKDAMRKYQIDLAFETEELRLKWVASKEHQDAFPKLAVLCQQVTWAGYDIISQKLG